jgi:hypothetical protein
VNRTIVLVSLHQRRPYYANSSLSVIDTSEESTNVDLKFGISKDVFRQFHQGELTMEIKQPTLFGMMD